MGIKKYIGIGALAAVTLTAGGIAIYSNIKASRLERQVQSANREIARLGREDRSKQKEISDLKEKTKRLKINVDVLDAESWLRQKNEEKEKKEKEKQQGTVVIPYQPGTAPLQPKITEPERGLERRVGLFEEAPEDKLKFGIEIKPYWGKRGELADGKEASFDVLSRFWVEGDVGNDLKFKLQAKLKSRESEFSRNHGRVFSVTNEFIEEEESVVPELAYLEWKGFKGGMIEVPWGLNKDYYDFRHLGVGPVINEILPERDLGLSYHGALENDRVRGEVYAWFTNGEGNAVRDANSALGIGTRGRLSFFFDKEKNDLVFAEGLFYDGTKHTTPIKRNLKVLGARAGFEFESRRFGDLKLTGSYWDIDRRFRDDWSDKEIEDYAYNDAAEQYLAENIDDLGRKWRTKSADLEFFYRLPVWDRRFFMLGNYSWTDPRDGSDESGFDEDIIRITGGLGLHLIRKKNVNLDVSYLHAINEDEIKREDGDREGNSVLNMKLRYNF